MEVGITFRRSTLVAAVDGAVAGTLCWRPHRWRAARHFWVAVAILSSVPVIVLSAYSVLLPGSDLRTGIVLTAYMASLVVVIYALVLSQFPATIAARRLGREATATHGAPPAGSWGGGMLAVAPQFRKKLIGGTTVAVALLRELEKVAREAGVTEVWAPTSSPDAARLYARLGGEKLAGFEWRGKEWSLWRLTIAAP